MSLFAGTRSPSPAETAGLIALGLTGEIVAAFNTAAMPRGMADNSGRFEIHIERE